MIRNYFLVAIRNLTRNKFFSSLNIFGLAISMSVCMAIIMLVADQLMYDRYNTSRDRIYRINTYNVDNNGVPTGRTHSATSPLPLKEELLHKYTGIEKAVTIKRGFGNGWLEFENQNVNVPLSGFFADPEVFDIFQYEFEYGDPSTALKDPYTVVLTKKAAKKLFKQENPLGQTVKVGDQGLYTVTGVLKETENKSHIVFEGLASMATVKTLEADGKFEKKLDDWSDFWNGWTYIVLQEGTTPEQIDQHLDDIYRDHVANVTNPDAFKAKFLLQNLMEITPGTMINNPIGPSLPWVFVYFLGGLAGIIMLTSCFNFTNLSIARSLKRAKEIGVRKVTGAGRWQIFIQFISESIVISFCALLFALAFLVVLKPLMLELNLVRLFRWDLTANYAVFGAFAVLAVVIGIFAGLFPAVVLSGFQPVKVLKGAGNLKLFSRMGLRKVLLTIQFSVSLIFIITVVVMYNQLDLFLTSDYGFNMKNNIVLKLNNTSASALKNELLKYGNIESVTAVSHIPAAGTTYGNGFKKELSEQEWTNLNYFSVDEDYVSNMHLKLVAGTFFQEGNPESNKNLIVLDEEAVKKFQFKTPHQAIGHAIIHQADSSSKTIIGVVKSFTHNSMMNKVEPMALMYRPEEVGLLQVSYSGSFTDAGKSVEKAWSITNPGLKIDYKNMESEIRYFYNTVFGDAVNVLGFIAFIAIVISCLGLLGMATYATETRLKEISVRKILGSTDQQLIVLLSKSFMKLLMIAILTGIPLAYFINNFWLQFFAHRTQIGPGTVLIGILSLLLLGGLTIGSQTVKAAFTNPVDNLKSE